VNRHRRREGAYSQFGFVIIGNEAARYAPSFLIQRSAALVRVHVVRGSVGFPERRVRQRGHVDRVVGTEFGPPFNEALYPEFVALLARLGIVRNAVLARDIEDSPEHVRAKCMARDYAAGRIRLARMRLSRVAVVGVRTEHTIQQPIARQAPNSSCTRSTGNPTTLL
jgi:hypothetical protein